MVKFGVIGASNMAKAHMNAIKHNTKAMLCAVCDADIERAKAAAEEFGVESCYSDYKEMLNSEIDAVVVCTPDFLHLPMSRDALNAGIHVLCEKPMTMTKEDSLELIKVAEKSKCKFMVGQVCRYAPAFKLAKELIDRGDIGELFYVESEYAHDYMKVRGTNDWRCDPKLPREPFLGGGCHAMDLLRWIAGNPTEVTAYSNHKLLQDWPVDDTTIAIFRFPNNVIGKVFVSISCKRDYTMRSVFYGTEGTIIADNTSNHISLYKTQFPTVSNPTNYTCPMQIPVNIANHNTIAEIAELVDCIENDKPVATNVREGASTVIACLAAVESTKKHASVEITY